MEIATLNLPGLSDLLVGMIKQEVARAPIDPDNG
jgi:hypothetical protein